MSITKLCKIRNCNSNGRFYPTIGYCGKHYQRYMKGSDILVSSKDPRVAVIEGDTAKIPLGVNAKYGYAIVDKEFAWLDKYNWHVSEGGYARSKTGGVNNIMHRLVIGTPREGYFVDHIDGNPLNNTVANLRFVTNRQNIMNQGLHKSNTSGYKGIYKVASKSGIRWRAKLNDNGKQVHGGTFRTKQEAALRYDELAIEYFGEHARLNFPT